MNTSTALSLLDNFNQLTPFSVGFDRVFDQLGRYANDKTSVGFPPYNIRKEGEYNFVIEMALAGFNKKDIGVEYADNQLTIKSVFEKEDKEDTSTTIHRGISKRQFKKTFTLADEVVVNGAELKDGMLIVDLEKIVPEEKKPRSIKISQL